LYEYGPAEQVRPMAFWRSEIFFPKIPRTFRLPALSGDYWAEILKKNQKTMQRFDPKTVLSYSGNGKEDLLSLTIRLG
jgi:hypothetical protein